MYGRLNPFKMRKGGQYLEPSAEASVGTPLPVDQKDWFKSSFESAKCCSLSPSKMSFLVILSMSYKKTNKARVRFRTKTN